WEGLGAGEAAIDWRGRPYDPANGPAAHPNSRFTVSARQCPSWTPRAEDPQGVPISAIVFGGRRASLVPLVFEARDWAHGVLVGASMASETTAAATGAVGVVRRDPMAMKPFCGYNFADYFGHWLSFDQPGLTLPRIFHVNWFRKDAAGRFMWPGFGDNMRVIEWMLGRVRGDAQATNTPIGLLPAVDALRLDGLALEPPILDALMAVGRAAWAEEMAAVRGFLLELGPRVPARLVAQCDAVLEALAEPSRHGSAALA
ncbi:MAG: phosphoenolpyruvate carboxykinase, partial [Gammaproteobacteria bacterium HGW-Gammaproteobacteria-7]